MEINYRSNPYNPNITSELREEYTRFFNDVVCPNAKEWINPFDGYFGIPDWKEMVSLRNELNDETSLFTIYSKENGTFEQMKKMLQVITIEEYIEYKNQNKDE